MSSSLCRTTIGAVFPLIHFMHLIHKLQSSVKYSVSFGLCQLILLMTVNSQLLMKMNKNFIVVDQFSLQQGNKFQFWQFG